MVFQYICSEFDIFYPSGDSRKLEREQILIWLLVDQ